METMRKGQRSINGSRSSIKGSLTLRALEAIEEIGCGVSDLCFIFTLPYGTSRGRALHELERRKIDRLVRIQRLREAKEKRQQVYNLLYHLQKDQLVARSHEQGLRLTGKGMRMLEKLRKRRERAVPSTAYEAKKSNTLTVFVFDIPEGDRYKRSWLRSALKNLNFTMLQKSVWIGKTKLPKSFLDDLEALDLFSYIHIFSVSKAGSISGLLGE